MLFLRAFYVYNNIQWHLEPRWNDKYVHYFDEVINNIVKKQSLSKGLSLLLTWLKEKLITYFLFSKTKIYFDICNLYTNLNEGELNI